MSPEDLAAELAETMTTTLAAALHAPDSATWPQLVDMAAANVVQCWTVRSDGERCVLGAYHPGECKW